MCNMEITKQRAHVTNHHNTEHDSLISLENPGVTLRYDYEIPEQKPEMFSIH